MAFRAKWLCMALVLVAGPSFAEEQIAWQTDIAKAVKQAKAEKKLVLVHFFGDSCPPCRVVEQKVFPQPKVVQSVMQNYVPVKINVDKAPKIASHYGVRQIPIDIFLSGAGQEFHRSLTKDSAADYVTLLDQLAIQTGIGTARQALLAEREAHDDFKPTAAQQPPQAQQQYVQNQYAAQNYTVNNRYAQPAAVQSQPENPGMTHFDVPTVYGDSQATSAAPQAQNGPYGSHPQVPPAGAGAVQGYAPQGSKPGQAALAQTQRATFQDPGDITAPQAIRNQFIPLRDLPPVGMDGYCPVSVAPPGPKLEGTWKKGDPRFGAVHRGRTYLFASAVEQAKFLADPDAYSPILSGADPVIFAEEGKLVEGKRKLGIAVPVGEGRNEMYFFATLENLERFHKNPQPFTVRAHQAMLKSETERK